MRIVERKRFGRDHWSLLLYIESRCVDHEGFFDGRHLRDKSRSNWKPEWGTRTKSKQLPQHDDWDCLKDLHAAGLTPSPDVFGLTPEGWRVAGLLRRNRAEGKSDAKYVDKPAQA